MVPMYRTTRLRLKLVRAHPNSQALADALALSLTDSLILSLADGDWLADPLADGD